MNTGADVKKETYVYLMHTQDHGTNVYKIGISRRPNSRFSGLRSKVGSDLSLIGSWKFADLPAAREIEAAWHEAFSGKRVRARVGDGYTEWFTLDQWDVKRFVTITTVWELAYWWNEDDANEIPFAGRNVLSSIREALAYISDASTEGIAA